MFSLRTFDIFTKQKIFSIKDFYREFGHIKWRNFNTELQFLYNDYRLLDVTTCFDLIYENDQAAALLYLHSMVVLL